ncbi:MAG: diaminopimelate epimerase [Pseudomonadota bacterium]|nr:diaminopimelate epimerase [Pseudomonadota bacterium]
MRLRFTKMHGAGNDFVVVDATKTPFALTTAQVQRLADRRFGVGADQVLLVEAAPSPEVDFAYRIFNGMSGEEVEQCGNGARCFVRFVRDHRLSAKQTLTVATRNRTLELRLADDGSVAVDMGPPDFAAERVPFDHRGLTPREPGVDGSLWLLPLADGDQVDVAVLSMGNPHAVQFVPDVDAAPVARQGPLLDAHPRFADGVNAGFAQIVARDRLRLRVFERGAGETLSCGSGACAAVAAGIRLGLLANKVEVQTRGGVLTIEWPGGAASITMAGPAETVFEGEIEL